MTDADTLFRTYRHRVFRYLYRTAGEVDTAHDLTQDVFLRVSRVAVPEASEGEQAAWRFRIARNILLDHFRRLGRRPRETSTESHEIELIARSRLIEGGRQSETMTAGPDSRFFVAREVKSTVRLEPDEVVAVELPRLGENASGAFTNQAFSITLRAHRIR